MQNNLKSADAAVLFIMGQSNAHAAKSYLLAKDRITTPLKNVFSLDRKENQSFNIDKVTWSGFTTEGKNLGETLDHTTSFAYYVASMWQQAIDNGKNLPDLYIVQLSIGGQGIIEGMWNPDRAPVIKPGQLWEVNISLYPLAKKIIPLALESLKQKFNNPLILGLHWIGSESDTHINCSSNENTCELFDNFFDDILSFADNCPLYIYKLVFPAKDEYPQENIDAINKHLFRQVTRHKNSYFVEIDKTDLWQPFDELKGVFAKDKVHYTEKVHHFFAKQFFDEISK